MFWNDDDAKRKREEEERLNRQREEAKKRLQAQQALKEKAAADKKRAIIQKKKQAEEREQSDREIEELMAKFQGKKEKEEGKTNLAKSHSISAVFGGGGPSCNFKQNQTVQAQPGQIVLPSVRDRAQEAQKAADEQIGKGGASGPSLPRPV
jgi:hypothetical protein